jgi:hypothetical protein
VPTIHNRKSPRRQFIVQPILDPASHDLADSTHYDKDKAKPTPPIIAMLPLEEEQDTNTNQEQANGVECCYFVAGDKPDQLLHDGPPLIGSASLAADKIAFVSAAYYALTTAQRFEMRIDRALKAAAEKVAQEEGRSLANLIIKLLRDYLARNRNRRS